MTHRREELLNYFGYRLTNRFAEGKISRTKTIICTVYGYRSIGNLASGIYLTNSDQLAA
ncbi:MAG: transposase [Anaerolineales bacterium]|nr:transposase [Anaerolineales bacterium]